MKPNKYKSIDQLREVSDDTELLNGVYGLLCEDTRLTGCRSASVEFITTVHYIEKYLKPGMRILDIGAGAGAYSIYFALKGYAVDAVELAGPNIAAFREKLTPDMNVRLFEANAVELGCLDGESYDIVLLMGPLYHLHKSEDRARCISEAMRCMKSDAVLFTAFITHDTVFLTELMRNREYFLNGDYDHDTMRLIDFPFVFFTVQECRDMLIQQGIKIFSEVAADGASELMADIIDGMNDESFSQYLKYHFSRCEKPDQLGFTNHLLLIGRKQ